MNFSDFFKSRDLAVQDPKFLLNDIFPISTADESAESALVKRKMLEAAAGIAPEFVGRQQRFKDLNIIHRSKRKKNGDEDNSADYHDDTDVENQRPLKKMLANLFQQMGPGYSRENPYDVDKEENSKEEKDEDDEKLLIDDEEEEKAKIELDSKIKLDIDEEFTNSPIAKKNITVPTSPAGAAFSSNLKVLKLTNKFLNTYRSELEDYRKVKNEEFDAFYRDLHRNMNDSQRDKLASTAKDINEDYQARHKMNTRGSGK